MAVSPNGLWLAEVGAKASQKFQFMTEISSTKPTPIKPMPKFLQTAVVRWCFYLLIILN